MVTQNINVTISQGEIFVFYLEDEPALDSNIRIFFNVQSPREQIVLNFTCGEDETTNINSIYGSGAATISYDGTKRFTVNNNEQNPYYELICSTAQYEEQPQPVYPRTDTEYYRLIDVSQGEQIFTALSTMNVPWRGLIQSSYLNLQYYGNYSGDKIVSPLVQKRLVNDQITSGDIYSYARTLVSMFGTNWAKQWETMSLQYDPIANYDMTEIMTDDVTETEYGKSHTRTDNLSHLRTDNLSHQRTDNLQHQRTDNLQHQRTDNLQDQRTDNLQHKKTGTEAETPAVSKTTNDSVYGFNSHSAVPSDSRSESTSGTDTTTFNTTDADTGTSTTASTGTSTMADTGTSTMADTGTSTLADTGTSTLADTGTVTDADTGSDTSTRNYTLTRTGNIGVTTSQQLIQSERDLWVWNFFTDIVFPDIDKVLTIQTY